MAVKKLEMRSSTKKKYLTLAGMLLFYIVMIISFGSLKNAMQGWLISICFNVILAVSLNLTVGILGDLSLGHAGFMCVGAFVGAFLSKLIYVMNPEMNEILRILIALAAGGVMAGVFGFLIGAVVLRLSGDYLAIVTLAFGEIIWKLCQSVNVLLTENGLKFKLGTIGFGAQEGGTVICNGAQGIYDIGKLGKRELFTVAFIMAFITVWIILNLIHSQRGRAIKAIRDNKIAAESIGLNLKKYKLTALTISAFFAGIGGVLFAFYNGQAVAGASDYGYTMSINILVFVVLGGMNSTLGAIIAATVLTVLPGWLRFLSTYRMLIYSIVLIVIMLFRSSPELRAALDRVTAPVSGFFKGLFGRKKKAAAGKENANG